MCIVALIFLCCVVLYTQSLGLFCNIPRSNGFVCYLNVLGIAVQSWVIYLFAVFLDAFREDKCSKNQRLKRRLFSKPKVLESLRTGLIYLLEQQ